LPPLADPGTVRGGVLPAVREATGLHETNSHFASVSLAQGRLGTLIVFIVPRSDGQATDLYIANSDGSGSHRLLERATDDGWSADGRYILTEWTPAEQPGGLAVITPDGSDFQVLLPFDACVRNGSGCTDGVGWGLPRP
jgi:hypothetical protein